MEIVFGVYAGSSIDEIIYNFEVMTLNRNMGVES